LVSSAGVAERPSPASEAPMSLMMTLAPARAIAIAISRPMPPPAPVTAATLPSNIPAIDRSHAAVRSNDEGRALVNSLDLVGVSRPPFSSERRGDGHDGDPGARRYRRVLNAHGAQV
jgi:hypothetical protein